MDTKVEPQIPVPTDAIDYAAIGASLAAGWLSHYAAGGVQKASVAAFIEAAGGIQAIAWNLIVETALLAGKGIHALEEPFLPVIAGIVAPVLSGIFGAEMDEGAFARKLAKGGGHAAAQAIVEGFLKAIEGDAAGELKPGPEGGARVASAAVAASLESSFNALVPSMLSHLLPFDIGHFTEIMELPEDIIRTLGVSRLVRRAIGPLVTACATTPMTWHVNKKYRPTMLSPGEIARQVTRGKYTLEDAKEELARAGYSDKRMEALLSAAAKTFSPSDVRTFQYRGYWTNEQALTHLKDQGYTQQQALDALRLEGLHRFETLESQEANAAVSAYAARDIDASTFASILRTAVSVEAERALYTELGNIRLSCNVKHLTIGQVEAMVKSGVLSVVDYRNAAIRAGYPDDEVTALELQLRWEMDKETSIEEHRRLLEAQREADRVARELERAARKAAVEAERLLHRRGDEAKLERAVIRGQIDMARLVEVLTPRYDADTVDILTSLVEDERLAYLAQQQAREDALKRASRRSVDVGALESAVMEHTLSLPEFTSRLRDLKFDQADADLLTATLKAKLDAATEAADDRARAVAAARIKHIDLGRFEMLVRRGLRTMPQYAALLLSLGFDAAAIAGMVDLLQLQIADDTAARELRAAAAARAATHGPTLEQMRRGVILKVKTIDEFQSWLVANGYTADAQIILMADLRQAVADADAARARREAGDAKGVQARVPLSTVRRAAQLGIVSPDVYIARLVADGYSDDDIALETDLLLFEIADVQAGRARRDALAAGPGAAGLTLAQVERAVKLGSASLDDYRARAIGLGYSNADVQTLTNTLADELVVLAAADARRRAAEEQLGQRDLSLAQLETSVIKGLVSMDAYVAQLGAWGYDEDEADLLAALLQLRLPPA